MKHIKTFEGKNNYHFFYNFNSSYNLKEIYDILDKLEEKNVSYKIFEIDNNFMIYFITSDNYLYNYYSRRFNYTIMSDNEFPNYKIVNREDLKIKLDSNKFNI